MRIGLVTTWFERGGAYVSRQFRAALQPQHEVLIYARGGEHYAENDPRWDEPQVTWAKRSLDPRPTTFHLAHFRKWLETHRPDLVFFNEQHWWKPVLLCAELGIKTGAYIDYYTEETVPLFGLYDFLICNTRRHASVFEWHPQAYYVPWGTDLEVFKPQACEPVVPGVITFFHSCGWDPVRKGTLVLLQAFAEVTGPCRLIIHSQIPISFEISDPRVELHQLTVPAPGLYHLGDVYVYPSRLDGVGLTMAEALASGLPLITTDHPPMNEFLEERSGRGVRVSRLYSRSDGYYWPQCEIDQHHLGSVMQECVDGPEALPALKIAARAFAEERLDWRKNSASLSGFFENSVVRRDDLKAAAAQMARGRYRLSQLTVGDIIRQYPLLYRLLKMIEKYLGERRRGRA